jgi:hypothetical protein
MPAALPYITAAASVAGVASSISAQRKAQSAAKDALAQQQQLAANLKYEPVNIENLKEQARQQAITNATQSLALERELSPDVAATRQMVAERVRSDLGLGGQLSPDVQAQVARASRVSGALSGAPAGPLTAAQIGLTAEGLRSQRLGQAEQFLTQNRLPVAGLDPGSLASAIVAQNAAMNQFNLAKAGVGANLAQSGAQVAAGAAGSQQGMTGTLLNQLTGGPQPGGLLGQLGKLPIFQGSTGGANVGSALSTPTLGMNAATPFAMPSIPSQVAPTESLFNYTIGSVPTGLPMQMPPTG